MLTLITDRECHIGIIFKRIFNLEIKKNYKQKNFFPQYSQFNLSQRKKIHIKIFLLILNFML